MTHYAIGLGSNLGDRLGFLRDAVAGLVELGEVVAVSGLYETEPIGGPEQDRFLNAVVLVESKLSPEEVLVGCQAIEGEAGRTREVRWGPRTLDVDVLVADGITMESAELTLPHPRAVERHFVLIPLVEVWPEAEVAPNLKAQDALESVDRSDEITLIQEDWSSRGSGSGVRGTTRS